MQEQSTSLSASNTNLVHLKCVSVKVGKKPVTCARVLIEEHFRSPSRDSAQKHNTDELFYFLVFAAGGCENFMVCLCYVDNGLAGSVKMLGNRRNLANYMFFHMFS